MNRIFPLSVCFYIIQNQGYSIKCLIKKFPAMLEREIWGNTLEDWGISILIILNLSFGLKEKSKIYFIPF